MTRRAHPARADALRLLRERFLNRTDLVAIQAPWGKPCPVDATEVLDDLLLGHLLGDAVPTTKVKYTNRRRAGAMMGWYRVGSYSPGSDNTTRWLCLDFDGAGHAGALDDPQAAAMAGAQAFTAAGLPCYLERSGSGRGWHLWCFFDPPLAAGKAQALGHALAPKDAPLANRQGECASPRSGRGIEVFPKQAKLGRSGYGNLVWLPWWYGAPTGANEFYRPGADGKLVAYVPTELAIAPIAAIESLLSALPSQPLPSGRGAKRAAHVLPAPRKSPPERGPHAESATDGAEDAIWPAWRRQALAALPLELIYGAWLTGKSVGRGWLECRDPDSPTGDQHPSAGVADGTGEAARGTFHSFLDERTLSVFDFLVARGDAADFRAARARVAMLSGVAEPVATLPPLPSDGSWDLPVNPPTDPSSEPRPATNEPATSEPATNEPAANEPAAAGPRPPTDSPAANSVRGDRRRPRILIRAREDEVIDDAIRALAKIDGVYDRGGVLVHVVRDPSRLAGIIRASHAPRIHALGAAGVRDRLSFAADWFTLRSREGDFEEVPAHIPSWVAPALESRKAWTGLRNLEGIIETPVIRSDGSVISTRGYDQRTGLLYEPNAAYPEVSPCPTDVEVRAAVDMLLDIVCDFPFASAAHRAAWLAGLLTPFARYAFTGPSPLFLIDANIAGVGKTKLVDIIGRIIAGREMARTAQAPDEAEELKRITAIAMEGDRTILLDNIRRPLGSGAFDSVLTATSINERILGRSEKALLPMLAIWYGTGNNVVLRGDTPRRTLHIRLESDHEQPENRSHFKYPDVVGWAQAHRAELAVAAVTILTGYCVAGKPDMGLEPWGSFEGWSALIRNAIVWSGLEDPCRARAALRASDSEVSALADLIAGWEDLNARAFPDQRGCSVAQALDALQADTSARSFGRLRAALAELCPHLPGQLPAARRVGNVLRAFRGRVVGRQRLVNRVLHGNNVWCVEYVGGDAQHT